MKDELKYEALFQEILEQLMAIKKLSDNPVSKDSIAITEELIDRIIQKHLVALGSINVKVQNTGIEAILKQWKIQHEELTKKITSLYLSQPQQDLGHSLIQNANEKPVISYSIRFVLGGAFLVFLLCWTSFYFYKQNALNEPEAIKYNFVKYSGSDSVRLLVDKIEKAWQDDSRRAYMINQVETLRRQMEDQLKE